MLYEKTKSTTEDGAKRAAAPSVTGRLARIFVLAGIVAVACLLFCFVINPLINPEWKKNLVKVTRGPVELRVSATGVIRPFNQVRVGPKSSSVVRKLYVKQGDYVTKGQLIADMDNSNLVGQEMSAQSAVGMAQANYQKALNGNRPEEIANAQAQVAKTEQAVRFSEQAVARSDAQVKANEAQNFRDETNSRRLSVLASEGAISDQERLNASTQAEVSRVALKQAKQELLQANATLAQSRAELQSIIQQFNMVKSGFRSEDVQVVKSARDQAVGNLKYLQSQMEDTHIRAPFDGVITQKYVDEGGIIVPTGASNANLAPGTSGGAAPNAIVSIAGNLELVSQIAETDMANVHIGQTVNIVANAYPDKVFHGKVNLIAPEAVVTNNVTTFEVHSSIDDDPSHVLMSGMNVDAEFVAGNEQDALLVPTVCITSQQGRTGVFVPRNGGQAVFKAVKTGSTAGTKTVILQGLKEDDEVFKGLTKTQLESQGYLDPENKKEAE